MLTVFLDDEVRSVLISWLRLAARMEAGANVVDQGLGKNPWGDVGRFREQVFAPVAEGAPPVDPGGGMSLVLTDAERAALADVLRGLSEAWAGGVPWSPLSTAERPAIESILERLT